jgi:hypothetical protein
MPLIDENGAVSSYLETRDVQHNPQDSRHAVGQFSFCGYDALYQDEDSCCSGGEGEAGAGKTRRGGRETMQLPMSI